MNDNAEEWDVIDVYTRQQAIEDGVLVDLSTNFPEDTRIFKFPVACTAAVWGLLKAAATAEGSDVGAYVWDMCFMSINAPSRRMLAYDTVLFEMGLPIGGPLYELKAVVGPGDDMSPVITFMEPDED